VSGGAKITDGAGNSAYVCSAPTPAFPVPTGFLVARTAGLWGYSTLPVVSTAGTLTLALKPDGTLWAWGSGAIGDGSTQRLSPVQVGSGFASVSTGGSHTVAVKTDGTLWAWGTNGYGEVGDGTTAERLSPVQVGRGYASVGAGRSHTIAIKTTGDLWAWGFNGFGQVGDGTTVVQRESPVWVGSGFASASAGSNHTLGLKTDGTLWAWGYDYFGQLGDGSGGGGDQVNAPEKVGSGYVSAFAFSGGSAGFKGDGTLWVWGKHLFRYVGARGDEPIYPDYAPVLVGSFVAVAEGVEHTVVLKPDGTLWAWGDNTYGQLGDGGPSGFRTTPVQVGSGFTAVAAGAYHTIAVKADGTLWGWGRNDAGQLGDGTTTQRSTPVQILLP
jgi:alpha-tubulin suppressor-like RCC1 family protein